MKYDHKLENIHVYPYTLTYTSKHLHICAYENDREYTCIFIHVNVHGKETHAYSCMLMYLVKNFHAYSYMLMSMVDNTHAYSYIMYMVKNFHAYSYILMSMVDNTLAYSYMLMYMVMNIHVCSHVNLDFTKVK